MELGLDMGKVIVLVLLVTVVFAQTKPTEDSKKKERVIKPDDISKEEHYGEGEEHNKEYDHEAFLGQEEARKFEELTPDQSKERLGELVKKKIDKDADGYVTEQELKDWIKFTQNKYIFDDADKQIVTNDLDKDGFVTWEEYKNATYGYIDNQGEDYDYKKMIGRDERRFTKADKNADKRLSKEEFVAFLHPENDEAMKDIVVEETLEDIDKDKDGTISLEEYIGDLWPTEDREKGDEPEWIATEKEQFTNHRDANKDGKMDKDEVRNWILPPEYDHISSEAKHLLQESDNDKDGKLSVDEIVEKYELFAGSQATDFGEALKTHDEF